MQINARWLEKLEIRFTTWVNQVYGDETTYDQGGNPTRWTAYWGGQTKLNTRLVISFFGDTPDEIVTCPEPALAITQTYFTGDNSSTGPRFPSDTDAKLWTVGPLPFGDQSIRAIKLQIEKTEINNRAPVQSYFTPIVSVVRVGHEWTVDAVIPPICPPQLLSGLRESWEAQDLNGTERRALSTVNNLESDSGLFLWSHQSSFTNKSATYNLWLRVNELPQPGELWNLLERSNMPTNNIALLQAGIDNSGNIVLSDAVTTNVLQAGLTAEQWQMVSFVGSYGANLAVFVDGAEVGNSASYRTYPFGANDQGNSFAMRIGGWRGSLGNVDFYDGALSSAQIRQIYDEQKPIYIDHILAQGAVVPELSPAIGTIPVSGGTTTTDLTLAPNVAWAATSSDPWLQITTPTSGSGSTTVAVFASANPFVAPRTAAITIAGKTFSVTQAGVGATVDYQDQVLGTDGGSISIDVTTSSGAQWTAVSHVSWLTVAIGQAGTGSGNTFIVADPIIDTSRSRTGSITVAGEIFYITQRGYGLSINPPVAEVGSNAAAGEVGVAAPLSAIWEAIVTESWITILGNTTGVGDGILRYSVTENTTGSTRTGRIVIAGETYAITQKTALDLTISAQGNGAVSGSGEYNTNADATLAAFPGTGFVFSHWTGDAVGRDNPLTLRMDSDKSVVATFIPKTTADALAAELASTQGYYTRSQIEDLAVGLPVISRDTASGKFGISFGLLKSGNLANWTDVTINSPDVTVENGQVRLQLTTQQDIEFYILKGGK
jgi:hypothetical protein